MLKFLLGRILPRERPLQLDLAFMRFADDAVEALGAIIRAASEGKLSVSEGAALATMMKSFREAIDLADVVKRLDTLEAKINGIAYHESASISTGRSP